MPFSHPTNKEAKVHGAMAQARISRSIGWADCKSSHLGFAQRNTQGVKVGASLVGVVPGGFRDSWWTPIGLPTFLTQLAQLVPCGEDVATLPNRPPLSLLISEDTAYI